MKKYYFLILSCLVVNQAFATTPICNSSQSKIIVEAVANAKKAMEDSLEVIDSLSNSSNPIFGKWFGVQLQERTRRIESNFLAMLGFASFQSYYCPLSSTSDLPWDEGDIAAVMPSDITSMFFTPDFFTLSDTGYDSKTGVIVHELSHYKLTGQTGDAGGRYGTNEAALRAMNDPDLASSTADNYQYFAEAILFNL